MGDFGSAFRFAIQLSICPDLASWTLVLTQIAVREGKIWGKISSPVSGRRLRRFALIQERQCGHGLVHVSEVQVGVHICRQGGSTVPHRPLRYL